MEYRPSEPQLSPLGVLVLIKLFVAEITFMLLLEPPNVAATKPARRVSFFIVFGLLPEGAASLVDNLGTSPASALFQTRRLDQMNPLLMTAWVPF
jgi:hypothetical protein